MGGNHRNLSDYDQPYNEYLGRYTDTTVYWLTWDGVNGQRVDTTDVTTILKLIIMKLVNGSILVVQVYHVEKCLIG